MIRQEDVSKGHGFHELTRIGNFLFLYSVDSHEK